MWSGIGTAGGQGRQCNERGGYHARYRIQDPVSQGSLLEVQLPMLMVPFIIAE